jgi:hypothetical protein
VGPILLKKQNLQKFQNMREYMVFEDGIPQIKLYIHS